MDIPYYGGIMRQRLTQTTGIIGVTPHMPMPLEAPKTMPILSGDDKMASSVPAPHSSWHFYNNRASPKDTELVAGIKESMNILLVFAGLFSATATAFLTFTLPLLQPSNGDITNQSLVTIIAKMGNSSYQAPDIPDFTVAPGLLIANCLVSASVAGNLLAAFCAILITQWAKNFTDGLQGIENEQYRARMRHFRFQGAKEWHLFDMAEVVPTLLHVSLVFFAGGATLFLFTINHTVAIITAIILGASSCSYFILSIAPLWSKAAPFRSPLTALLEYFAVKIPILVISFLVKLRNSLHLVKGNQTPQKTVDAQVDILRREKPLYRFVHKKWDLDVSVLVHLMQSADRHSERNVLETCLVDLQTLFKVEEETPELFDHEEILSTYFFLGKYSLHWEGGVSSFFNSQHNRGLKLCIFLAWFLELSERWPKERQNALKLRIPLLEDAHIPHATREYGEDNRQPEFLIVGYLAGNALKHLHGGDDPGCWCFDESRRRDVYAMFIASYDPGVGIDLSVGKLVIRYIARQTRCLAGRSESWDQPLPRWINRIARVATHFRLYDAQFQSTWESFLAQYEGRKHLRPLVVRWISAIQEVVRGRLPRYTAKKENNPAIYKWINGTAYGPVLDTISAAVVAPKLQINPILRHHSAQEEKGPRWDILHYLGSWPALDTPFDQSQIRASATFPRMNSITLHSNHVSRPIVIFGTGSGRAVTCGDVFVGMTEFFREELPDNVYNRAIPSEKAKLNANYCRNRFGTGSSPLKGRTGFTNGDLLEDYTLFDGLDDDEDFVRAALGLETEPAVHKEGLEKDKSTRPKRRQCIGRLVLRLERRGAVDRPFAKEDGDDANDVQPPAEWRASSLEEYCRPRNPHDKNGSQGPNAETTGDWDRDSRQVSYIPGRLNKRKVRFALENTTIESQDSLNGHPAEESTTSSMTTPREGEVPLQQGGSMTPRPRTLPRQKLADIPKKSSSCEDATVSPSKSTCMMSSCHTPCPEDHSLLWHGQPAPKHLTQTLRLPMYTSATPPGIDLDPVVSQEYNEKEDNPSIDKWINGTTYGPVLDTISAAVVVPKLQINPILCHHSAQEEKGRRWDILHYLGRWPALDAPFDQSQIRASATFPRMNSVTLHSNHVSRPIVIFGTGSGGAVTCGDVLIGITEFFREEPPGDVYNRAIRSEEAKPNANYCCNQFGTGSSPLKGRTGFTNGDLSEDYTLFDGLADDEDFVRAALGLETEPAVHNEGLEKDESTRPRRRQYIGHLVLRLERRGAVDRPFADEDGDDANDVQPPAEWRASDSIPMEHGEGHILSHQLRHQSNPPQVRSELPVGIQTGPTTDVTTPGIYANVVAQQIQQGKEGDFEEYCPPRNPHDKKAPRVPGTETTGEVFYIPARLNKLEVTIALENTTIESQDIPNGEPVDGSTTSSKNRSGEVPLQQGGSMMPCPRKLPHHKLARIPKKLSSCENTPVSPWKSTGVMSGGRTPCPEGHSLLWHDQPRPKHLTWSQAREAMEDDLDSSLAPWTPREQNPTILNILEEKAKLWEPNSETLPERKSPETDSRDESGSVQSLGPLDPLSSGEVAFSVGGGMGNQTATLPASTRSNILPVPGTAGSAAVGLAPAGSTRFNIIDAASSGKDQSMAQPLPSRSHFALAETLRRLLQFGQNWGKENNSKINNIL